MSELPQTLLTTPRFRVVRHRLREADGVETCKETIEHPGAVVILPLLDDQRVCLIRNCRVAVGETLIEVPAGTLEPGEVPDLAAARELQEETGYRAARWEKLLEFYVSPGILNERMHLYLAQGLECGPQSLDAGEQIETLLVPWDQALAMLRDGQIRDAKTIIALLWWDRRRSK